MKTINVKLDWFANTNHVGFFVALHKGYYREAGLDVCVSDGVYSGAPKSEGSDALGVAYESADVIIASQPAALMSMDKGDDLIAVATITQRNDSGILSLKQSGINNPGDLTGKRLSYWETPWFDSLVGKAVNENGGDYSMVRPVKKEVDDIEKSLGNEVDAVWIYKCWEYFVMQHADIQVNYFEFADYGTLYDYCAPAVMATQSLIKAASDDLRAFLKQTAKGYVESVQDPDAAAGILIQYMQKADKRDPELVRDSLRYISTRFLDKTGNWGYIEPVRWNTLADYMVKQGLIKERNGHDYSNDFLS